ncbi:MAG: DDE-type integrase/transposase/recombinase [Candidatus Bipolaricaulis anaerobius]|mgnify:CR=1 FL=1
MDKKIELVEVHRGKHGLNRCLRALGVSKGTWHRHQCRPAVPAADEKLKAEVLSVVREHPAYGYRRIQVELRERTGERVNHKRLRRLLGTWDLALPRKVARPWPSGVRQILRTGRGKLDLVQGREMEPLEALSTDFTEIRYAGGTKKAHLMAMVDVGSAWVPGWAVGSSADRSLALRCWETVKEALAHVGRGTEGVIVHHDHDAVYTSYDWLQTLLIRDRARVSYAERGARDNPWIESLWGHFKVENGSLLSEAATLEELEWVIDRQMLYYNQERRHSGLGYRAPMAYLEDEGIHPEGIHPKVLVEIGPRSGSVLGAQVRGRLLPSRAQQRRGETWRWRMRWQG